MKKRILLALIIAVLLLSLLLSSCQTGGVPQAQYDQVNAQLADAQARLAEMQKSLADLQAQKSAADKELTAAKTTITDLQKQVASLQSQVGQSSLVGATPTETAIKIVKNYHDTHVYSTYDLFVCSDMASEVWNMLKAQGISAIVVVGNKDALISDILQSNHAWVLAVVATGEYLALETTGGFAVKKTENPLYYIGWSFSSPADLKANNDLRKEYNTRVGFRNDMAAEDRTVNEAFKKTTDPQTQDKLEAVHIKLVELIQKQETALNNLMNNIKKLAVPLY